MYVFLLFFFSADIPYLLIKVYFSVALIFLFSFHMLIIASLKFIHGALVSFPVVVTKYSGRSNLREKHCLSWPESQDSRNLMQLATLCLWSEKESNEHMHDNSQEGFLYSYTDLML